MTQFAEVLRWVVHGGASLRASAAPAGKGGPSPRARRDERRAASTEVHDAAATGAAGKAPVRARRLVSARRVMERPVFSVSGERCGRIGELSVEKATGRIVYALVVSHNWLGLVDHACAVPWPLLRYDAAKEGYVAPVERTDILGMPNPTQEELERLGLTGASLDRLATLYQAYPTIPYF